MIFKPVYLDPFSVIAIMLLTPTLGRDLFLSHLKIIGTFWCYFQTCRLIMAVIWPDRE